MWISSSFYVHLTLIDFSDKTAFRRIPSIFHNMQLAPTVCLLSWGPTPFIFILSPSIGCEAPFCLPVPSLLLSTPLPRPWSLYFLITPVTFVVSLLYNEYFPLLNYFITSIYIPYIDSCGPECCLVSITSALQCTVST